MLFKKAERSVEKEAARPPAVRHAAMAFCRCTFAVQNETARDSAKRSRFKPHGKKVVTAQT